MIASRELPVCGSGKLKGCAGHHRSLTISMMMILVRARQLIGAPAGIRTPNQQIMSLLL
jgi:hypothetical protein